MAAKKNTDKYANIINVTVTETAANTLTFQEIEVGFSMFERVGLLIHRVEYAPEDAAYNSLISSGDTLKCALTASNTIDTINPSERAAIDTIRWHAKDVGTVADLMVYQIPAVKDFSNLPMGGILIAPRPLYVGAEATGFSAAISVQVRLYFTVVSMADSDYFELLESRRFYG